MRKEPVDDLRLLFLRLIAERYPQACAKLFELNDPEQWAQEYRVSAAWLASFLQRAIEQGGKHMDWVSRRCDEALFTPAAAAAWLRTLQDFQGAQAWGRMLQAVRPGRVKYLDPIIDKRSGEKHCRWLVDWAIGRKSDRELGEDSEISDTREVGKRRRELAKALGLSLDCQQGRRS